MSDANGSLLSAVAAVFEAMDWPLAADPEQELLHGSFRGRSGAWRVVAIARERQRQILFYSELDYRIPADTRPAAHEFLTRANWGLPAGCFEIDLDSGSVRLRSSLDVRGVDPTLDLVRPMVEMNVMVMERYVPGLEATLSGRLSPREAIAEVEAEAA